MTDNNTLKGKLVDAGALADWICEFHSADVYWAVSALYNAPAVNAEPIIEAEWIYDEEDECFICSHCDLSALNNYRGLSVASERCPHCGAHMKEYVQKENPNE